MLLGEEKQNKTKIKSDKSTKNSIEGQSIPTAILKFLPSVQKRNKLRFPQFPLNRNNLINLRRIVQASGQL